MSAGWLKSLRMRLVAGFILVSVPAMLASAYVAARLISNAFEANVSLWLDETSRFFKLEIREAASEAQRVAGVITQRLQNATEEDLHHPDNIEKELAILGSVGYDLIAIYSETRDILFASRDIRMLTTLPPQDQQGIFQVETEGKRYILSGAVQSVTIRGKRYFVLVGTWVDEVYLGGIKVVTSLDVQLFMRKAGGGFESVLPGSKEALPQLPISAENLARLEQGEETVFEARDSTHPTHAIYTAFRGVDNAMVGYASIGLKEDAGFFERIGRGRLFLGIFLFGTLLSVLVGVGMSGLLVRPMNALTQGLREITRGDYRQRVPEAGGQEIAELARGFNTMAEQLGKLQALEAELRRRDRFAALGQAAMVIAHEVRNPLGIIKTSTEVVRNRAHLAASEDRMLGYVVDEVRRIETLIRDFLDFAKPKALVTSRFALRAVLDRVAAFAAPELASRKITLELGDDSGGAEIEGDPDQLHQACLNLLLNAFDALPNGGIITAQITGAPDTVALTITDSGSGVPEDIIGQVFNPFFTTKAKGTGLGLAKVMTVATAHGGTASCASGPEGGAAFTITIPRPPARGAA